MAATLHLRSLTLSDSLVGLLTIEICYQSQWNLKVLFSKVSSKGGWILIVEEHNILTRINGKFGSGNVLARFAWENHMTKLSTKKPLIYICTPY